MSEGAERIGQVRGSSADNDPMLQAYGRYWLPWMKQMIQAQRSQAKSLASIERQLSEKMRADDK